MYRPDRLAIRVNFGNFEQVVYQHIPVTGNDECVPGSAGENRAQQPILEMLRLQRGPESRPTGRIHRLEKSPCRIGR